MRNKLVKFKMRKQHESINYRQENAGTSALMSKIGSDDSFTIYQFHHSVPHPEKPPIPVRAVQIN